MTAGAHPGAGLRLTVVGNPGNRRVALLAAAAESLGLAAPRVVPWLEVLRGEAEFHAGEVVRIDSPGEDAEVTRLLRGGSEPVDMYRVEGTRAWYEGFVAALGKLHAQIEEAGAVALADAAETAIAFDKARCSAFLSERGVSVPRAIPEIVDYQTLHAFMAECDAPELFVKIRHGSSASGVLQVSYYEGRELWATTSTELHRTSPVEYELYNSLRVRRYDREREVRMIVDRLALDGLHAEVAISHIGELFAVMTERRPCFAIVCSDHGTLYGEDGLTGHRLAHPLVWTVPYAEFVLPARQGATYAAV